MKLLKIVLVGVLLFWGVGTVKADSTSNETALSNAISPYVGSGDNIPENGDTLVNVNGRPAGSPSCDPTTATAGSDGSLNYECVNDGTTLITSITFEVLASNTTGGGLTCESELTWIGWTGPTTPSQNATGVDTCTFTAPAQGTFWNELGTALIPLGEGQANDCDLDDFLLGIPVGCDVSVTTTTMPGQKQSLFVADALVGLAVNGNQLPVLTPEPGTLGLVLMGLVLVAFRRRSALRDTRATSGTALLVS
ncbi:MAG TPA: PEP-CTERM sorting domain-containing protein [Candidatus Acidoferrum sp.]|nr:PEP-CTERM sorting domain-containing protein [Candidatus Acidoferrum sp.]